jgi:hypothetical protein
LAGRRGKNPARTIEKRSNDPIRALLAARNPKFSVATDRTRPQPGLTQKSSPVPLLPLRRALTAHVVETAYERGWSELQNGALISAAEEADFEVFVTTDKNLKYQQKLAERRLAIVVLLSTSWPRIQNVLPSVVAAVADASPGSYQEVSV